LIHAAVGLAGGVGVILTKRAGFSANARSNHAAARSSHTGDGSPSVESAPATAGPGSAYRHDPSTRSPIRRTLRKTACRLLPIMLQWINNCPSYRTEERIVSWLFRSAAGCALLVAANGVNAAANAAVLDYQFTVTDSAGSIPDIFYGVLAYTSLDASTTSPTQATMAPGDVVEFDLLAPAGLQFVVTGLPTNVYLTVGPSGSFSTDVGPQSFSVTGQGGSGSIGVTGNFVTDPANSLWFASAGFTVTGTVSFTGLSVQFVVPDGFSALTAAPLLSPEVIAYETYSDPGSIISLELVPTDAPEPATLAMLCAGVAGLTAVRRRPRRRPE
jgi:hypothetical protein